MMLKFQSIHTLQFLLQFAYRTPLYYKRLPEITSPTVFYCYCSPVTQTATGHVLFCITISRLEPARNYFRLSIAACACSTYNCWISGSSPSPLTRQVTSHNRLSQTQSSSFRPHRQPYRYWHGLLQPPSEALIRLSCTLSRQPPLRRPLRMALPLRYLHSSSQSPHLLHLCVYLVGLCLGSVAHKADGCLTVIILLGCVSDRFCNCLEILVRG